MYGPMIALLNQQPPELSTDLPLVEPLNVDFLHDYGHQHVLNRAHQSFSFMFGPSLLNFLNYHPFYFKSPQSKLWRSQINEDIFISEISYGITESK